MLKVLVPDLPTTDELLPYLRRIDEAKQYSNDGPLVRELEARAGGVAVANATVGLELAAKYSFRLRSVRIPAFTFPATATALLRAGFEPRICDVDRETWALPNSDVQSLAVTPFGAPIVSNAGLIDAAAAWGNGQTGNRVYSLHATKTFPAGEGGLVCGDPELLEYVRKARNFGMVNGIVRQRDGTNAKMSEYHAAVALASLDRMDHSKRYLLELRYRTNLAGLVEMQERPQTGCYAQFPVLVPERERVAKELAEQGIETRAWYCPTLEKHPCMANLGTDGPLKTAKILSEQLLCLPFHTHLTEGDVDRVCSCLTESLHHRRRLRA